MRKFWTLAAAVFVLVLTATGSGWAAPANDEMVEHRVWLPVVWAPSLEAMYPGCPFQVFLESPENGALLPSGATAARWRNTSPGTLEGHIQIATDQEFVHMIFDGTSGTRDYFDLSSLSLENGGTYFWRVRPACFYPRGGYEFGPWSVTWSFTIAP